MVEPTEEQLAVIHSPCLGVTKVLAYAGTGKTSTLIEYARARTGLRGLYVAFNKATQMDASGKFPSQVLCRTIHSLAFARFGRLYSHKLAASLRTSDVIRLLNLSYDYDFASLVIDTLCAFITSADAEFPLTACSPSKEVHCPRIRGEFAASMAKRLWEMMCDSKSPVPMMHDGYLKLFQLSNPRLSFDYIMLDECQDTNPVTAAIILGQTCPRILVGDPYQSIYQFRGAKNAMDLVEADQTFYLTHSFRFGPRLAGLATRLLFEFFGETHPLVGLGTDTALCRHDPKSPFATICRTNAEVFNRAVGAVSVGASLGFVGGIGSYGFDRFVDAYSLSIGDTRAVRDATIRQFSRYSDYEIYALESGDREAKMVQNIVTTYGDLIPELIEKFKNHTVPSLDEADLVLSTPHKAKGLEFDSVVMADDFCELIGSTGPIKDGDEYNPEEVRLLYVALTRARKTLELNSQLAIFAKWAAIPFDAFAGIDDSVNERAVIFKEDTVPAIRHAFAGENLSLF